MRRSLAILVAAALLLTAATPALARHVKPALAMGSISLTSPGPFHMGDTVTVAWSTDSTSAEALIHVYALDGSTLQMTYLDLYDAMANPSTVLGPTPVWSDPQPGTITVALTELDPTTGLQVVIATDPTTYELAP